MIVLEGAVAQMLIHRDPAYAQAAGQIAADLLTKQGKASISCIDA